MSDYPCCSTCCIAGLVMILVWKFIRRNHADVTPYDYLDVLSYHVWKSGRQIRTEMEKLKGGKIDIGELYIALARLEDEGYVERRIVDHPDPEVREMREFNKVHEFRRISNGGRRRPDDEDETQALMTPVIQPG